MARSRRETRKHEFQRAVRPTNPKARAPRLVGEVPGLIVRAYILDASAVRRSTSELDP